MWRLFSALFIILLYHYQTPAQLVLDPIQDIPFSDGEKMLDLPWMGGLNSAQYNKADLDGDGTEELVIYDRSARTYLIFKVINNQYVPAFDYNALLPNIPDGWVLFVDYNNDGKKDIFSNGDRGIIVYKNVTPAGQTAKWKKVADPLLTTGFSGKINLIANAMDVPAIADIDGDGDMDILVYNFAIGGYIRFNKNLSMELFGNADSLEYEINTRTWGEFEECDCNVFAFSGETCEDLSGGRIMHPGGKALLAFDADGDGDKDLLVGHEQCIELYFYENMGNRDSAYMLDYSNMFPVGTTPANFHVFPAAFFEDLDFDGVKDLIVTPGFEENYDFKIDFGRSNWFYKNLGEDDNPDFVFQKDNFMQEQSLDFGEFSVPVSHDLDGDGRADLLVAANNHWNGSNFSGVIYKILNAGSASGPAFVLDDQDYLGISGLNLINPVINLADLNGDGSPDLLYTGFTTENFKPQTWMFPNQNTANQPPAFDLNQKLQIEMPASMTTGDSPAFVEINQDGYPDLLIGKRNGALEYYRNTSSNTFELVDPAYLGIERDFSQVRLNVVASPVDVDLDGKMDLIVTDATGEARIYFEFALQAGSEPVFVSLVHKNAITGQDQFLKFDTKTWLTGADFFGLGTQSLIAGGSRGGLQFFKNEAIGNADSGNPLDVQIYPNPLFDMQSLNIKANKNVTVELISVLGQRLRTPFQIRKFVTTSIDLTHLTNGAYILRSSTDDGVSSASLFLIQR